MRARGETDIGRREGGTEAGKSVGTQTQGEGEGRGGELTVQCSLFTIRSSRFTIRSSRFTIHDSQFTVQDSQIERGGREGGWD